MLVHPECPPEVVALADGTGSTSWILNEVESAPPGGEFIIGTETGVVERLRVTAPEQRCFLLRQGFICPNMKKTIIDDVRRALEQDAPVIELDADLMNAARASLARMIAV